MNTYDDVRYELSAYKAHIVESDLPLYYQVAYILEHFLSRNILKPGSRFFSEEEISSQLEVSRPTVNRATNILIKNGLLKRIRGKGTIVKKLKDVSLVYMSTLLSFGEMVDKLGRNHHTNLIERTKENSSGSVSNSLGINRGDPVIHLKRLRFVEKVPLIVVDQYLPFSRFSELLKIDEKSFRADLYNLLHEYYKLDIVRAEREVMAVRMSLIDAELLKVEIWEPCLRMRGIAYDSDGRAVDYFDARFSGTQCILKSSIKRATDYFPKKI